MINALSIDVEDWFCTHNMSQVIKKEEWETCESRIMENTKKTLDILDHYDTGATFFFLGWIAERFPELVLEIDNSGHEIATHGYSHRLLTELNPVEFAEEMVRSIEILKKYTKQDIIGFRAPSFTLIKKTLWALDILSKNGIKYDSSIYPIGFHPDYGLKNAPLGPYKIKEDLIEFPLSCLRIFGKNIPFSGGAYFRIFPYRFTRFCIKRCNRDGRPAIFYFHPWKLDPNQPKVVLPISKKFRQYYNLQRTENRLKALLQDFEFTTIKKVLAL